MQTEVLKSSKIAIAVKKIDKSNGKNVVLTYWADKWGNLYVLKKGNYCRLC